jgi:hypothetical protein
MSHLFAILRSFRNLPFSGNFGTSLVRQGDYSAKWIGSQLGDNTGISSLTGGACVLTRGTYATVRLAPQTFLE